MSPSVTFHDFSAGGQTGQLIRDKDWSTTRLGPRESWSRSLNNYLSMIFELPSAAIVFWGEEQVQLYNDGYSVIMGPRHPEHLGSTFRECWPEAYDTIHPWMQRVLQNGETVQVVRTLVPLTRYGFVEEAYFTFSFSPLRDDDGHIAGILQLVTEVTDAVLGERRAAVLHALSNQIAHAKTTLDATRLATEVLSDHEAEIPFARIYLPDDNDVFHLEEQGIPELVQAAHERRLVLLEGSKSFAAPILSADQRRVVAILVGGLSPRLRFDDHYRSFIDLVIAQLATLMAASRAFDDERKRAEALAEIDRAKTEFFSNVSHEFRTPLTLILGPLEDALADPSKALQGASLDVVHRNALRMLRLVNSLLDFARLEANRLTSSFEPTDLSTLTAGLAGSFQSLVETAGLKLRVECDPIAEHVRVDRGQWEKIVLNLISNAFKFTFEGEIAVGLRDREGQIQLSVSDTGTGIPQDELPKIFDRFHRVKGARGRSFEGSGIGLALVRELAKQHEGSVEVQSAIGKGTTFVVSIPKRVEPTTDVSDAVDLNTPSYVLEASRWTAGAPESRAEPHTTSASASGSDRARVLVADDNADMREHLERLLSPTWSVELARDGQEALESARRDPPDLILSDVMMPRMDGVALVAALRADPRTSMVPIILLSARAGEEAVVGGFQTGVDDYLVKPFAARELLARVHAHLHMARLRREWSSELERANSELEAFSYSVAHDLRSPLRAIDGFSAALVDDHGGTLDESARHNLERVRAATARMSQLIDDLLTLSRITRTAIARERVDLTAIARGILLDLHEREPTRDVDLVVADGLVATADPRLLGVALQNLLGNAWKYCRRQERGRIEVGHEMRHNEPIYFIRDNGAGFDMEHASRLFLPFQRLHTDAEFEGTGIGLATVHRVVTRHGGQIWADATPGNGATFYFTLGRA